MVQAVSATEAKKKRKKLEYGGVDYYRTDYLLPPCSIQASLDGVPLNRRGAQAFLVEQSPGSVIRPHFHLSNQFQVFVQGAGTLAAIP